MKNLTCLLLIAFLIASCKKDTVKNYVTLSGTIKNNNTDTLSILQNTGIVKTIKVNMDGTFSDTLKVKAGEYILHAGKEQVRLYLKNSYDLKIALNAQEFYKSLKFDGLGESVNNYFVKKELLKEELFNDDDLFTMSKFDFNKKVEATSIKLASLFDNIVPKDLDTAFVNKQKRELFSIKTQFNEMFDDKQKLFSLNGRNSPKFVDYENYNGGTTSLDDLKGKYVYIDLWATWCGPCKIEIPFLKRVEKDYHGKNIAFVSISLDKQKNHETWKKMVAEKELTGVQLYAKENLDFVMAFNVSSIPRFILIDPQGKVLKADAPRPSSKKLIALFKALEI